MLIIVPGICNSGHVAKQICDTQTNSPPPSSVHKPFLSGR